MHVGRDMVDYANRKKKQLEELGYDEYRHKLKIGFSPLTFEDLVDGFLGLKELSTKTFDHFDRRFGVNLLNSELSVGTTSTIRIQPQSSGRCALKVIGKNTGETAKVEGDIFFALVINTTRIFKVACENVDVRHAHNVEGFSYINVWRRW